MESPSTRARVPTKVVSRYTGNSAPRIQIRQACFQGLVGGRGTGFTAAQASRVGRVGNPTPSLAVEREAGSDSLHMEFWVGTLATQPGGTFTVA
ncbi:hypothetical protein GCM10008949_34940 [Deinococcus humi]|nr:hypothetical protein GCM10008949_34940 [Deinococcus humi]